MPVLITVFMVILFDGVCNLCNGFVRFVIKRDKNKVFHFASLQSKYGAGLIAHFNLPPAGPETIILYNEGKILEESDAVLTIIGSLNGAWKAFTVFKLVPRFIRNGCYRLVAKNRYRIFGKKDRCMVPSGDIKDRFLDEITF